MGKMTFPVISFCSESDTMCDPDGSKMLIDRSKVSHLTLALVTTAVHVRMDTATNGSFNVW